MTKTGRFDPACTFLLNQGYENLFEMTARPSVWRCKGCDVEVKTMDRREHFAHHKASKGQSPADHKPVAVDQPKEDEAIMARSSAGAKTEQTRARREAAAEKTTSTAPAAAAEKPKAAEKTTAPKATEKPKAPAVAADDGKLLSGLLTKVSKEIKGTETKANPKVGYTAIRLAGKVIGYVWTTKSGLRVEAAIKPTDVDKSHRKAVDQCKRSPSIAAQTKVTADSGTDVAMAMLKRAGEVAQEAQAAKAAKPSKETAAAAA